MKKYSYFSGNDQYYPFNEFIPTGMVQEYSRDLDRYENKERDGSEFKEFRRKKRLKRLKKIKELLDYKNKALSPSPFYSSLYGYTGFEGAMTSPLEYYNGTITDSPDAITNPYNNSYQVAANERIKIRAMIFDDYLPQYNIPIINDKSEEIVDFNPISEPFKSKEKALEVANDLRRKGHEEIVIWHGETKHKWFHEGTPGHRVEIKEWWQVGQL